MKNLNKSHVNNEKNIIDDKYFNDKLGEFITHKFKISIYKDLTIRLPDGTTMYILGKNKISHITTWVDKNNELIAACEMSSLIYKYDGKQLITPGNSKIYKDNYKNPLQFLYKYEQKRSNSIILCDDIKTEDNKNIWIDWIKYPKQNGIKIWGIYDIESENITEASVEKIEKLWGIDFNHSSKVEGKKMIIEFE